MRLAAFSVRNRTLIAMTVLAVVAWGVLNYLDISRREDPEIKISLALVITIWPGKSAEDVVPNVIITPHTAGSHPRYSESAARIFRTNLEAFLAGGEMVNVYRRERGY